MIAAVLPPILWVRIVKNLQFMVNWLYEGTESFSGSDFTFSLVHNRRTVSISTASLHTLPYPTLERFLQRQQRSFFIKSSCVAS